MRNASASTPTPIAESVKKEFAEEQRKAGKLTKIPQLRKLPDYWSPYNYGKYNPAFEVDTGLSAERVAEITDGLCACSTGFHVHPKIVKLLEERSEMGHGKRPIDFGFAELLAYGSFVLEGNPVRLTGQDSQRGTFSQRHAVLIDTQTEQEYLPLAHLYPRKPSAKFTILRSPKRPASALNTASPATTPKASSCGKRNSGIS